MRGPTAILSAALALAALCPAGAAEPAIPHAQDRPPNEPYAPEEAARRMTVPEGFKVEVVASEPDIVNPVAMTIDERGRFWITESLEYPRHAAGPGRDRVKIVEDTDGDGKADRFTVFADGLNIPSGIAVGHGGVWVANAPDILFLRDTDGDGKADTREVVVTGFGRADTHELPNSLTWGPDGWLYGWNGVFNESVITHKGKEHRFTCAIFRIHPKTRDFEIFCEGTSNPWGIAWNDDGEAFSSACVIDHLWHLSESNYYHRQGGPYPPFTWYSPSIVGHRHYKAAYCGIHYFDSPAYPEKYRGKLFMGNIHAGAINVDALGRNGSTYRGEPGPDFLTANDAWFMPVVQKTGPDGSLYILDWYDRYHCYQDANRDPAGIDRLKGRLYRVRYGDTPRVPAFDLAKVQETTLIYHLRDPNVYYRDTAQRLLTERGDQPGTRRLLGSIVARKNVPRRGRMHALWALVGSGPLDLPLHLKLLADEDPGFRAWGVRAAGNQHRVDPPVREAVAALVADPDPAVRLQVAIAARKVEGLDPIGLLVESLAKAGDDPLIPHVAWQNLHPLLEDDGARFVAEVGPIDLKGAPALAALMPRVVGRLLARKDPDPAPLVALFAILAAGRDASPQAAEPCLAALAARVQTGEIAGARLEALRSGLAPTLGQILAGPADSPLRIEAALLAASWKDGAALKVIRELPARPGVPEARRLQAIDALIAAGDATAVEAVAATLAADAKGSLDFRGKALAALGRLDDPKVAEIVLAAYPKLAPELKPRAIVLLAQRDAWGRSLVAAIGRKVVPADALNINEVRKLLGSKDADLVKAAKAIWGHVREGRNPDREAVVARMRAFLRGHKGDPKAGRAAFQKLCAQCHKIYSEGQEVGPDLTGVGRNSYEALLSNVFDPNLVIGAAYQATTVATRDGRVLTGLVAEDGPRRMVLKAQGGKQEIIPRDDVEELKTSPLSLMPEGIEAQLTEAEWADLFAFLSLDKPPGDPSARPIPGAGEVAPRPARNLAELDAIVAAFAPGFSARAGGFADLDQSPGLAAEHRGRRGVLVTHPVSEQQPGVLRAAVAVPAGKKTRLVLDVSHHETGDWRLIVKADGKAIIHDAIVGPATTRGGWAEVVVDLTPFAGRTINLELLNAATGWAWEYGFWGRIAIVSE